MGQGGENIAQYLGKSLSQLAKTIVKQLSVSIVSTNEKIWRETIFKDQRAYDTFKSDESLFDKFERLKERLILMSLILRRYPELRTIASEITVSTHIFDTKTLLFKDLSEPQELTFLDYAIHVIQPPTYPLNAGLVTSFFERSGPGYTLEVEDKIITSHEYFSRLTIQKCLEALTVLSENNELETQKRRQLSFVYAQTIRNALRSNWKSSEYASHSNLEVISQLEKIITANFSKGRTLTDLIELNELLRIQVHEQMMNAYAHLNLPNAQDKQPYNSKEFTKEEYNCIRSIFHFDRDYSKLDNYTNKVEPLFKDIHRASKIDDSANSPLRVTNIEDPNRKALLVRAIIEGKTVDSTVKPLKLADKCPSQNFLVIF